MVTAAPTAVTVGAAFPPRRGVTVPRPKEPFRWSRMTVWEALWLVCFLAVLAGFVLIAIEDILID